MVLDIRPLTQEQRQAARRAARLAVVRSIGPRSAREQFAHHTISKYPPTVTRLISILCIVLLLAAFTPSAPGLFGDFGVAEAQLAPVYGSYLRAWLVYCNTGCPHHGYRNLGKHPIETVNAYLATVR